MLHGRTQQMKYLLPADRRVNVPAIIGFLAGIAIAVPLVIFAPDIPSVIGGLIGGIVVYPVVARITGHYRRGRLTVKGIGTSTGNHIKYEVIMLSLQLLNQTISIRQLQLSHLLSHNLKMLIKIRIILLV